MRTPIEKTWLGRVCLTVVLAGLSLSASPVCADWMPSTGAETAPNFAEIEVLDDRVRVMLEIDFADYPAFVPAPAEPIPADTEPNLADLSRATGGAFKVFDASVLGASVLGASVSDANGGVIAPSIRSIEIRDRKPRPTARSFSASSVLPPRGARVIAVELDFAVSERPEKLTFIPPLDDKGVATVNVGFLAHHKGVPVSDYRYLSRPETLRLDWEDPWYSAFENPNLTRHHRSALMSFVSIEPREVRHEIIVRLRDLEGWTALDLGTAETLDVDQIADVKQAAGRFFAGLDPAVIDGESVRPAAIQVVVLEVDAKGVRVVEDEKTRNRATALLGVILSYPHRVLPKQVDMTWQLFTKGAQEVPTSVADPAGAVPGQVTPDAPEITWTNFLKKWKDPAIVPVRAGTGRDLSIPILSILLFALAAAFVIEAFRARHRGRWGALAALAGVAGLAAIHGPALTVTLPGGPDETDATEITEGIVRNAGVAMLETEPQTFDAALEDFVAQDEIRPVGEEMQRGLSVRLPTGARALTETIKDVTVEQVEPREDGVNILASWTALVSGGHWGHMHRREIAYRALMDVTQDAGVWHLRGLTVLSARPKTPDRPKGPNGPSP